MKYTDEEVVKIIIDNSITNIKDLISLNISSESTLRRKLKSMENTGYINLYYGGNIEIIPQSKISIEDQHRKSLNSELKEEIAFKASQFVKKDDIIFIDNGTTVRRMLKYLKNKNVKIYTNGYNHINEAQKYDIDINLIPGNVLYKEASLVGEKSIIFLSNIYFNKTFVGANGYDNKHVTTPNETEANLKLSALKNSEKGYILIDKTKEGIRNKHVVCKISEYTIVTNNEKVE